MLLTERTVDGAVVVTLSGRLVSDGSHLALDHQVRRLMDSGFRRLILDVADVTQVDSTGLGALILARATLRGAGGELLLQGVTTRLRNLLAVTQAARPTPLVSVRRGAPAHRPARARRLTR